MTTVYNEKNVCSICGVESEHCIIGSTNSMGFPDLDLRPAEMQRSTMHYWIQRCPECGYCSPDISECDDMTKEIVNSDSYKLQLTDEDFPELANSFLCYSMLLEAKDDFAEASYHYLNAAWVCDDSAQKLSLGCRQKALENMKKALEAEITMYDDDATALLVETDLLRRIGKFEEALQFIEENKNKIKDKMLKKILAFEKALIINNDKKCHSASEIEGINNS
jgi:tetratricopeptide (TPR) repeat protein